MMQICTKICCFISIEYMQDPSKFRSQSKIQFLIMTFTDSCKDTFQGPLHLVTPKLFISLIFINLGYFYWFQSPTGQILWFQVPTAVGAHGWQKMLISYQYFCPKSIKMDLKSIHLDHPRGRPWQKSWYQGAHRGRFTTLQSIMNSKLSQHRFWHCYENWFFKTLQTIPHNL